ncbi:hypothetical protein BZL30_1106 [Mycobacterium kansasii]|uniref:Uncharacterized protein n=1 Tax=Mycobacterium kansasii TaxID=1768 RepID=A0A1V3XRU4_MYCKA|nr:hypothetical protein BZL30_1106 [Mycobacterium kansasii]
MSGAVRTDLILSAEIMVIALNEVASQRFLPRLVILVVVALIITAVVYGAVGAIVKMDDVGLRLAETGSRLGRQVGRAWSPRCRDCSQRSRRSGRWPCCGWAVTSCWSAATASAGTCRTH